MGEKLSVLEQVKARAAALRQAHEERAAAAAREKERLNRRFQACWKVGKAFQETARAAGLCDLPLARRTFCVSCVRRERLYGVAHTSGGDGHMVSAAPDWTLSDFVPAGTKSLSCLVFCVESDHDGCEAWLTHDGERVDADTALLMVADLAERLARAAQDGGEEVPF